VLHPQCARKVKGFEIIDKIVLRIFLMNDDEWWVLDDGWGGFGGLTQIFRILENDNGLNHETKFAARRG
jgi:hypothetical protein